MFVHDSSAAVVREHAVDFAERHFRREPIAPSAAPSPLALSVSANAFRRYVLALSAAPGGVAQALAWLGLDAARSTLAQAPDSADAWKNIGEIELHRGAPGTPTPRYRASFDPVLDLSIVRATYALKLRVRAGARRFHDPR